MISFFLRVYPCKLGGNPQKYTFLKTGDGTFSMYAYPGDIYIKVTIYITNKCLAQIFNYTNRTASVHGFRY